MKLNPMRYFLLCMMMVNVHVAVFSTEESAKEPTPITTPKRILFIGNSYTGVNNLPKVFSDIVTSAGHALPEVKAATPGGRTLMKHVERQETLVLIDQGTWDVVILQGQSQEASMAVAGFLQGAQGLCQHIRTKNPAAQIVFYQTWARHADYWNKKDVNLSVGNDPAEMQARNHASYNKAAAMNMGSVVAPAGDAWALNYAQTNALRLHSKDNSHPAYSGTYLAALVIYGTVYQTKNMNLTYHGSLKAEEGRYLQGLAAQALTANQK